MDNIPSLEKREIKFRSPSSSEDLNAFQDEVLYDVLNLFNKANNLYKLLDETRDIVDSEQRYMQMKIQSLENSIELLNQKFEDKVTASGGAAYNRTLNVYPADMYIENKTVDSAYIDLLTSDVTLAYSSKTSKVNIADESLGEVFIPPSLNVQVDMESNTGILSYEENDPINAFNGDTNKYWRRKIVTDNNVNEVTVTMTIALPEDAISNREINGVIINPYPYSSVDLLNVEYKLFGDWKSIPSFDQHSKCELVPFTDVFGNNSYKPIIPESENIKFVFKDISASEFRFTFRQQHYIQVGDKREFHLGAREIEVVNYKFNKETAAMYSKVIFPETGINIVYDVKAILNNQAEVGANVTQYEIYMLDEFDNPTKVPESFPFEVSNGKLLIKSVLHKNNTSPTLNKIQIIYRTR